MKIFLGSKTRILISVAVSDIGPNLVSEYMNLRMAEFSTVCVLLYVVYYIASGLQKLKITVFIYCSIVVVLKEKNFRSVE